MPRVAVSFSHTCRTTRQRQPSAPPSFCYSLFFSLHGLSLTLFHHHCRCRHLWCLSMNQRRDLEGNNQWRLRRVRCRMHR
ncbi:hypothetical protein AHAS_Ahas04G0102900 [Arachis hypogaea]